MDFSVLRMQMIRAREQAVIDDLNRIEKGEKPTLHDKLLQDVHNAGIRTQLYLR